MSRQAPGGLLKSSLQSLEMHLNSRPSGSLAQHGPMSMSKAVADFLVFDSGNLVATLNNPPRMEELLSGEIGHTPALAASAPSAIPVHSDSSPAIEVVDVPGKGKGIVALRDLAEGDLLFVEKPLATLEWDMDYVESELNADLTRQIEALGEEDRQAYYSLHIADPVKFDYRPAAIFRTNAIGLGGSRHLGGAFKLASRFNHSCSTSVLYEWDEKDQVLLLKVVRNIDPSRNPGWRFIQRLESKLGRLNSLR